MDFIRNLIDEGLVESQIDETSMERIRGRRTRRLSNERRVALYGYLVGLENGVRATKFIDMAQDGKSVPKSFIEAYLPIIDMIEDIVDAGPQGIQQLRALHKRIK
jgi:hypothetical protein